MEGEMRPLEVWFVVSFRLCFGFLGPRPYYL